MKTPIYMDYHSTTPVDPRVLDAMLPFFREIFGNPASRQHQFGWIAEEAVESSRTTVANSIGALPKEIIFTSGATESNNLAIKGVAEIYAQKGDHIITAATEHKAVLDSCKNLERHGFKITYLPVDKYGRISLNLLSESITSKTMLVSVMTANNEIGTIQDITEIGKLCHEKNVLFHTDAAQAIGKLRIDVQKMNIDMMSLSGHKIYGPKGIGILFVRASGPKVKLMMQMDGGGHERGIRSGTPNVPSIVGIAKAIEISSQVLEEETIRLKSYRDKMWKAFQENIEDISLNGDPERRLPNNLNINFHHIENSALMMSMKDIAVSTGSACTTGDPEPSHVLKALKLPPDRLHSAIRFGLGRFTTEEEVDYVIDKVIKNIKMLRESSSTFKLKNRKPMYYE
ncbi:MAG: IscS subfamily cysteine desulfurase [Ignavibacteriales bacterium]|nr:IscS subfamily cysteine desulfurase [Ignavibacteriales bacterium]